jgi:tetratricopeptide (TPR) repeat protein
VEIFSRPFDEKGRRSSESQILPVLRAVLQAENRAEAKRILKQHPELLSAEANALLGELIAQSDKDQAESLNAIGEIFGRCREVGIDKAFAEQTDDLLLPPVLEAILNELSQPEQPGEMPARIQLCHTALALLRREQVPPLWAMLHQGLAVYLIKNLLGDRAENLELAIAHFEQALTVYTLEGFPQQWAKTKNMLGVAYGERIRSERAVNLEQAIAHFEQALTVRTREAFPKDWAQTQHNLATAYSARIRDERAMNLEQAIAHFELALIVYTRADFP